MGKDFESGEIPYEATMPGRHFLPTSELADRARSKWPILLGAMRSLLRECPVHEDDLVPGWVQISESILVLVVARWSEFGLEYFRGRSLYEVNSSSTEATS